MGVVMKTDPYTTEVRVNGRTYPVAAGLFEVAVEDVPHLVASGFRVNADPSQAEIVVVETVPPATPDPQPAADGSAASAPADEAETADAGDSTAESAEAPSEPSQTASADAGVVAPLPQGEVLPEAPIA